MTLRRHHNLTNKPITFLGASYNPVDGGTNISNPAAVVPVSNLIEGDLVILICSSRSATSTQTISTTGGQTWNALTAMTSNQNATRMFWCRFNGTWAANPAFTASAGSPRSIGMLAFRPSIPGKSWAVDVAIQNSTATYSSAGNTVNIPGQTTTRQKTVTIGVAANNGDTRYAVVQSPWSQIDLGAQYNNTAQLSITIAYRIKSVEGPTGDFNKVINSSPGLGNTGQSIVTFYET